MNDHDRAAVLAQVAYEGVARALMVGFDKCLMEERPVTQLQQIDLLTSALACCDGLAGELERTLAFDGILRFHAEAWALRDADAAA